MLGKKLLLGLGVVGAGIVAMVVGSKKSSAAQAAPSSPPVPQKTPPGTPPGGLIPPADILQKIASAAASGDPNVMDQVASQIDALGYHQQAADLRNMGALLRQGQQVLKLPEQSPPPEPPQVKPPSPPPPSAQKQEPPIPPVVPGQQIPAPSYVDGSTWKLMWLDGSTGTSHLSDPSGIDWAVPPTNVKPNGTMSGGLPGADFYLIDSRVVRNPVKSSSYYVKSPIGNIPLPNVPVSPPVAPPPVAPPAAPPVAGIPPAIAAAINAAVARANPEELTILAWNLASQGFPDLANQVLARVGQIRKQRSTSVVGKILASKVALNVHTTKAGREDANLIRQFQTNEDLKNSKGQYDGMYGVATALRVADYGIVPDKPRHWGTAAGGMPSVTADKKKWTTAMLNFAKADPTRAEEWAAAGKV